MLQSAAAMQESGRSVLRTLAGMGDVEVGTSEKHCVYSEDKIRLYRYAALARSANLKPVLICYAMVNRPYLLDLQPDRSFIRELLLSGLDVYLLDWGYPDGADRFSGFDSYVDGLPAPLRRIRTERAGPRFAHLARVSARAAP